MTESINPKCSSSNNMRKIQLTKGQFAIVDEVDFERINAHKWYATWGDNLQAFYATRNLCDPNGKRRTILMHREIMSAPKGLDVDHKNRDTLDNRRDNLRVCSTSQNMANARLSKSNSSGLKGVSWRRDCEKWRARLGIDFKIKHLGLFTTALEAALAYDRAATEHFGEFALTNKKLGLIP